MRALVSALVFLILCALLVLAYVLLYSATHGWEMS